MRLKMLLILIAVVFSFNVVVAQAEINIPETIRVGLKFNTTAPPSVRVSSLTGMEFGYRGDNGFISLFTYGKNDNLYVRKDSYFADKNGLFIEVQPEEVVETQGVHYGPYHIQVSGGFSQRAQAEALLEQVRQKDIEGYLVYNGEWKVWVGRFVSAEDMEGKLGEISSRLGNQYQIYPVVPSGGRIQVNDESGKVVFMFEGKDRFLVVRALEQKGTVPLVNVDGRRFRGDIEFKRHNGGNITVVNTLPLQEYLYGVVPREMNPNWHIEALKAQAVAARNYAIVNMGKHGGYGFDVCSTTDCQVYGGYDWEKESSNFAVDQTKGRIMVYNGKPITAFFHSASGGYTENAENVWSISLPYIKAVEDKFSEASPHNSWQRVYTREEINSILSEHGIQIGSVQDIRVDRYSPTGRSLEMTIKGSRGSTTLEKERSRALFGYNNLKSTMFTIETDADLYVVGGIGKPVQRIRSTDARVITAGGIKPLTQGPDLLKIYNGQSYSAVNKYPTKFIFNGRGWGHGLGMSQWGAKGMAEAGYSYIDILQYYYQGAVVQ